MRPVLVIAVVLGAFAVAGVFSPAKSQPQPQSVRAEPDALYGVGKAPFAHLAATSCAAASCHGGGEIGKLGSEYSTWAQEAFPTAGGDPHSKAYSVLFNADSVRMGKLLGITPHRDATCLKCHAVEGVKDAAKSDQMLSEGVGCGACHGPSEKWVSIHYLDEWKTLSHREKWEKYGFLPANNLVARSLNCVSCHVGDSEREVNHDLIAAGHPRLAFESARFHFNPEYRKHWQEKTPQPDFEVRAWVVGQAATLRSASDLLRARAERAAKDDSKTPWPEFSGYSCYACHQKVGDTDIRGSSSATTRPAGVPGWEVWSNTAFDTARDSCGLAYPGLTSPELPEVKKLRELMDSKRPPAPKAVAEQAKKAVAELDKWLAALQAADDARRERVPIDATRTLAHKLATNALSKDGAKLADHDWDALAANYLGCAAMYHASGGAAGSEWGKPLRDVRDALKFPLAVKGTRFDSPAHFNRATLDLLKTNFGQLRDATAPSGEKR